jgi:hypothetical protein
VEKKQLDIQVEPVVMVAVAMAARETELKH